MTVLKTLQKRANLQKFEKIFRFSAVSLSTNFFIGFSLLQADFQAPAFTVLFCTDSAFPPETGL